jgi:hypothetical protein
MSDRENILAKKIDINAIEIMGPAEDMRINLGFGA